VRVLITGAGGFVGSSVARTVVRAGCEAYAWVHGPTERLDGLASSLTIEKWDVLDTADVESRIARLRPDACIHCAWVAVPGEYLVSPENAAHARGGLGLARALAGAGCRRFVGLGSCIEYAPSPKAVDEDAPTSPMTPYARGKLDFLRGLERLAARSGMELAWARLFYLYGPFEDQRRLVPTVIRALLSGDPAKLTKGDQIRDFLHVSDVADALWAIVRSEANGAFNVGSGRPVTVRTLALTLGEIMGRSDLVELGALPYATGERMVMYADNRRLVDACDWSPRFGLRGGLEATVDWWRSRVRH
jgi:nucleoside-diphosphate-sugar epimerase